MSLIVGFGAALAIAGLMLITLRPKANPRLGRILMVLGALILAIVMLQILQQPTFRPDG